MINPRGGIKPRLSRNCETSSGGWEGFRTNSKICDCVSYILCLLMGFLSNASYIDTELSELISTFTRTDVFNKGLEIQQSQCDTGTSYRVLADCPSDLLAAYDPVGQVTAIEDLISQQAPISVVLRLLCLASITSGGIKAKTLENIKREVLQVRTSTVDSRASTDPAFLDVWL